MTLGFLSGSKNFCKLLCVSCEVFVLHGYDWIHWVPKSCTTTAYRWLLRDSQPSLRTLWSAVIKSPKFSAPGTAPPMRLLHGALVILVLRKISQFWSLGKWVSTLCLPQSSRLLDVGSKDNSWQELACESLCSGTLSSTRFSLNSCSHSDMSEFNRSLRSKSWSSFLFGLGFIGWLGQQVSQFFPFNIFTWHRYGIGTYPTQVSPCSNPIVAWHSWRCHWWSRRAWGRRRMINFLPWRCHWSWRMRTGRRTRWQAWN